MKLSETILFDLALESLSLFPSIYLSNITIICGTYHETGSVRQYKPTYLSNRIFLTQRFHFKKWDVNSMLSADAAKLVKMD